MTSKLRPAFPENDIVTSGIEDSAARRFRGDRGGMMGWKKMADDDLKSDENSRYDEELLSANWNPVIGLIEWSCAKTLDCVGSDAEKDLSDEDIDALLNRIYSLGG